MPEEIRLDFAVENKHLIAAAEKHLGLRNLTGGGTVELEGVARMLLGTLCEGSSAVRLSIHGYAGGAAQAVTITLTGQAVDVAKYAKALQDLVA
jgi:hypothetical protein